MSRVGLGRHGQLDSDAGDPLDGLVNLFDLGIVLAVGFLIAGLSLSLRSHSKPHAQTNTNTQTLTTPAKQHSASGTGKALGQVFQLPNGQLVLVKK
jgi:hypothetical protein